MPKNLTEWLSEIVDAYYYAHETVSFEIITEDQFPEKELFLTTPHVCVKMRGLKITEIDLQKATATMMVNYMAKEDASEGIFYNPHIAFGFAYLLIHFAVGLLSKDKLIEILDFMEDNEVELDYAINARIRKTGKESYRNFPLH